MIKSNFKNMKSGVRYHENASCKVSICVAIPNSMRTKTREITHVDVPENLRGQGMATQMLLNVCDEADVHKMILVLFPKPFGEGPKLSKDKLVEWYSRRFGFQIIQLNPVMMARMPFATPGPFRPTEIAYVTNKELK